jgi:hypothetical protein
LTPQVFSSFSLTGDEGFDPNDFTAWTGLAPTTSWRKGDVSRGRACQHSFWCVEVGPDLTFDHEAQVVRLLDVIEPHAKAIRHVIEANNVDAQAGLWWGELDEAGSTPGVHLSSIVLGRITAIRDGLDIDV